MNDNNEIKKENNKKDKSKCCCKIWCLFRWIIGVLIAILLIVCIFIGVYSFVINKSLLNDETISFITWLVCTAIIVITAIICFTIAVCKYMQSKKEKCNSYDEALTEMLTRKNNEKKEEKNNNEQNKD